MRNRSLPTQKSLKPILEKSNYLMQNRDFLLQYTIPQLLRWRVTTSGQRTALREKDFGRWISYTWDEYYAYTRKTGLGLREIGLGQEDKIALICDNIPEVLFVSIGAQAMGGISAGIYQTTLPKSSIFWM